jgi:hypothetical protein
VCAVWCAECEAVNRFFPARQVPKKIFNEFSRNTENALSWERDHKVIYEIKVYVVSLVLSIVFKIVFGMFLSPLVCLKSGKKVMSGNL